MPTRAAGELYWAGRAADARSDQFSFCLTLYEALFRERPFRLGAGARFQGPALVFEAQKSAKRTCSSRIMPRLLRLR